MCEMVCQIVQKKQEEKQIEEEQAANAQYWKIPACCDDDDDYNSAITPVLSTKETENSPSMGDEHLDTIPAAESDEVIKSSVENLVPIPSEFEGIPDTMCDVHLYDDTLYKENIEYVKASPHNSELVSLEVAEIVISEVEEIEDDNLREKLVNIHLLIANIEAFKDNPTPSSELLTKSSSTSFKSFLEETNTFHNSLLEFENFYFDLEEISSGSTTTHSDISLYDSFTFDLSNDQCAPTDKSDFTHEEFVNELAHIISLLDYDCFYFRNFSNPALNDNPTPSSNCKTKSPSTSPKSFLEETNTFHNSLPEFENFYFDLEKISSGSTTTHSDISLPDYEAFSFDDGHIEEISSDSTTTHSDLPDPGELMSILNFGIRENLFSTTCVNLPVEDDYSPLLAYVVWIFLAYLTYPVIPPYLYPFGNEDAIFDPCITINHFYSFKPGLSHQCGAFKKFNTHRSHLNEWPMIINRKNIPILDVLLFHFYPS
nr:hypothetical protein [Tanacetum cinerariifolium]